MNPAEGRTLLSLNLKFIEAINIFLAKKIVKVMKRLLIPQ